MIVDGLGSWLDWFLHTICVNGITTAILVPFVILLCRFFDRRPAIQNLLWLMILIKFMTPQIPGFAWVIPTSIVGSESNLTSSLPNDQIVSADSSIWHSIEPSNPTEHSVPFVSPLSDGSGRSVVTIGSQPALSISPWSLLQAAVCVMWALGAGYFLVSMVSGLRAQRRVLKRTTKPC